MKPIIATLPFLFFACAHETRPMAEVSPKDVENFDVSVHGRLAAECGVSEYKDRIHFDEAKDDALGKIADCLVRGELKGHNIRVVGHTDVRGSNAYNKQLGKERAEAVAKYLEAKGVPSNKIIRTSRGEVQATGVEQLDRRVDIGLAD